jgi:hypothetical protein
MHVSWKLLRSTFEKKVGLPRSISSREVAQFPFGKAGQYKACTGWKFARVSRRISDIRLWALLKVLKSAAESVCRSKLLNLFNPVLNRLLPLFTNNMNLEGDVTIP